MTTPDKAQEPNKARFQWQKDAPKDGPLTVDELKRILHYNPETGAFTRLVRFSQKEMAGGIAGYKHHTGYLHVKIKQTSYALHRLAWFYMYGQFPDGFIDHINGIRDDNRIKNLRAVTRKENSWNGRIGSANTSGYKGVHWDKKGNFNWRAGIQIDGKSIYLGRFKTPEEAGAAYKKASIEMHGEFSPFQPNAVYGASDDAR